MFSRRIAACLVGGLAVAVGGCTTTISRPRLAKNIGEDAASFSAAYARAANNQILLTILQARDRLPRQYLTVSGISDNPTATNSATLKINPLNLNNALDPYRASSSDLSTSLQTKPTYGVTPVTPENLGKGIYAPLPASVLQHYWAADWPRDLLLQLLVSNAVKGACQDGFPEPELKSSAALEIVKPPKAGAKPGPEAPAESKAQSTPCEFTAKADEAPVDASVLVSELVKDAPDVYVIRSPLVEEAGTAKALSYAFQFATRAKSQSQTEGANSYVILKPVYQTSCRLVASVSDKKQRSELVKIAGADKSAVYEEKGNGAELRSCNKDLGVALVRADHGAPPVVYLLNLRSFEEIVYFLGEHSREGGKMPHVWAPGAATNATTACTGDGGGCVALFSIQTSKPEERLQDSDFAAALTYRNTHYLAGRATDKDHQDRTGTVMTLLSQVYSLAASPDALRPPTRFVVN